MPVAAAAIRIDNEVFSDAFIRSPLWVEICYSLLECYQKPELYCNSCAIFIVDRETSVIVY